MDIDSEVIEVFHFFFSLFVVLYQLLQKWRVRLRKWSIVGRSGQDLLESVLQAINVLPFFSVESEASLWFFSLFIAVFSGVILLILSGEFFELRLQAESVMVSVLVPKFTEFFSLSLFESQGKSIYFDSLSSQIFNLILWSFVLIEDNVSESLIKSGVDRLESKLFTYLVLDSGEGDFLLLVGLYNKYVWIDILWLRDLRLLLMVVMVISRLFRESWNLLISFSSDHSILLVQFNLLWILDWINNLLFCDVHFSDLVAFHDQLKTDESISWFSNFLVEEFISFEVIITQIIFNLCSNFLDCAHYGS